MEGEGLQDRKINKLAAIFKPDPVTEYINKTRYGTAELHEGHSIIIPTGRFSETKYTKADWGWTTDRTSAIYDSMIFGDEFDLGPDPTLPNTDRISVTKSDRSRVIAGGRDRAFAAGRSVLDLGSGEAVALLQYSRMYPQTIFIGVDSGYDRTIKVDAKKRGVQLTKDDWNTLASIPDSSIDTILSCQGAFMHGIGTRYGRNTDALLDAINRVSKSSAILRFDMLNHALQYDENLENKLEQRGWRLSYVDNGDDVNVVAVKG